MYVARLSSLRRAKREPWARSSVRLSRARAPLLGLSAIVLCPNRDRFDRWIVSEPAIETILPALFSPLGDPCRRIPRGVSIASARARQANGAPRPWLALRAVRPSGAATVAPRSV